MEKDRLTQWFTATGCILNQTGIDNRLIICNTVPGFGSTLLCNVDIRHGTTRVLEGSSQSVVSTSYATPAITMITVASEDGSANSLHTEGGQKIQIHGMNFSIPGISLEGYYSGDPSNGWYCAADCSITDNSSVAVCESVPGIENMVKLEKIDYW